MIGRPLFRPAIALALLAAVPVSALQAQVAPAISAEPEPARLEAARELISVMVPDAQRDQMADTMTESVLADLGKDLMAYVGTESRIADKAAARATVESFVTEQRAKLGRQVRGTMPAMMERMARAHARLLTVADLRAIAAFYRTPAGVAFARATPTMTADPEVSEGQTLALTGIVETLFQESEAVKLHLIDAAAAGERK